jgi:hypothetical protein
VRWLPATGIGGAALVLAGWCGGTGIAGADPAPPPPPAGPKTTIDHDGTFVVGTDIAPGIYSSPGPVSGGTCYWKRLNSLSGTDIIDNALSLKPQVVQIDATDKAFKTDGCQPWQKNDAATPDTGLPPMAAKAQLLQGVLGMLGSGGAPAPAATPPAGAAPAGAAPAGPPAGAAPAGPPAGAPPLQPGG